jgi:uncharacterized protein YdeI (YjbR/CyaY-like superfamily)
VGALDDGERVRAEDAVAWRAWLQENHTRAHGAWLLRTRTGSTEVLIDYEPAIEQALCFGWVDGPIRTFDELSAGLWFSPRRPQSVWAASNKARVERLEAAGLMTDAGRLAIAKARANGSWSVLEGPEAGIEPPELTAALDAVPAARAAWDAFPPSARKLGLTNVAMAKRPETRAARIAKLVADAASGIRPTT